MPPAFFIKVQPTKRPFLNKEKHFVITRRYEKDAGSNLYRVQELDSGKRLEGKFLRKELFAVRDNVR